MKSCNIVSENQSINQLVDGKFAEERDESIFEAVQKFRESLTATNKFVVLNDVYTFPKSDPEAFDYHLESLLKKKISRKEICLDSLTESIAICRTIVAEYAQDPGSLSEWCSIHESFQQVYSYVGIENARPFAARSVSLKEGVTHEELVARIKEELLSVMKLSFDETFAWLMTQ